MLYRLIPILAKTLNIIGCGGPLTTKLTVKELYARYSSSCNSLKVGSDTLV
jgi:hypothetical protein